MTDLVYQTTLGGNLTLRATNTSSNPIITIPAVTANLVTTGDTATVTANMIVPGALSQTATYTQGGTGSVSRTIQNRLQDAVSVKDFGATGDGTTDDTTAIQNAINAAGATKTLFFPSGTYICSDLTFATNISWLSNNALLKYKTGFVSTNNWISAITDNQSTNIDGLSFDYQYNTNKKGILNIGGNPNNCSILNCNFFNMNTYNAIVGFFTSTNSTNGNILFQDSNFTNSINGGGAISLSAYDGVTGINNISLINCNANNVGGTVFGITRYTTRDVNTFKNVNVIGCTVNVNGQGLYGSLSIEMTSITNFIISNCNLNNSGTNSPNGSTGISIGTVKGVSITGNTISNQGGTSAEIGESSQLVFSNNTVINSPNMFAGNGVNYSDIVISNNTYTNSGFTSAPSSSYYAIYLIGISGTYTRNNFVVSNNIFTNPTYLKNLIQLNYATNVLIDNNIYYASTDTCPATFSATGTSNSVKYYNNIIEYNANFTSNNPSLTGVFLIDNISTNVEVKNNSIISKATSSSDATFPFVFGQYSGALAFNAINIENNIIVGFFQTLGYFNDTANNISFINNNVSNATFGATSNPFTITYGKFNKSLDGNAIPTVGTFSRGDFICNRSPSVGQPKGWLCTVSGTPGTWVSTGNL